MIAIQLFRSNKAASMYMLPFRWTTNLQENDDNHKTRECTACETSGL
jgi:hypothetical protein